MDRLLADELGREPVARAVRDALDFPVPLVEVRPGVFALELFHGPTLAFKDFGARFFAAVLDLVRDPGTGSGHHPHRHQRRHRRGGGPGVLEAAGGAGRGALPARPGLGPPGAAVRDPRRERHRPLRRRRLRRLPGAGEGRLRGRGALGPPRPHLGELDQRRAPAAADPLLRRGGGRSSAAGGSPSRR